MDHGELRDLYQEVILDHNKHPRNFHKLTKSTHHADGFNPLCGDEIHLYLEMEGDVIKDIGFEGSGCAISKASSSLMTSSLKGKSRQEAREIFQKFVKMVTSAMETAAPDPDLGKLAVFAGVREFPARVKCATLSWHTLASALEGKADTVTTEGEKDPFGGEALDPSALKEKIIAAIQTCYDPEIPVNIYELGLIYDIQVAPEGDVIVKMTLTSPACPVAGSLPPEVEEKMRGVPGVKSAKVEIVWDPPWSPSLMTEEAKLQLGM